MSRWVLLSYIDRNKPVVLPPETSGDIHFLTKKFLEFFNYPTNVKLSITFQRYDDEWKDYVDLDENEIVVDKDKLCVLLYPTLP